MVTPDGYTVQPGITIPSDTLTVTINAAGQVFAKIAGQVAESNVGQLQLANFQNPAGLENIGNNLLKETPASGTATTGVPGATGFGEIQQGFVESSNVDPVQEITNLITAQRAYEMNSKVIETSDQMMSTVNNIR
jgi:flagellar basal-body rod protein FlgG